MKISSIVYRIWYHEVRMSSIVHFWHHEEKISSIIVFDLTSRPEDIFHSTLDLTSQDEDIFHISWFNTTRWGYPPLFIWSHVPYQQVQGHLGQTGKQVLWPHHRSHRNSPTFRRPMSYHLGNVGICGQCHRRSSCTSLRYISKIENRN